jgi:hypothetical protein
MCHVVKGTFDYQNLHLHRKIGSGFGGKNLAFIIVHTESGKNKPL